MHSGYDFPLNPLHLIPGYAGMLVVWGGVLGVWGCGVGVVSWQCRCGVGVVSW